MRLNALLVENDPNENKCFFSLQKITVFLHLHFKIVAIQNIFSSEKICKYNFKHFVAWSQDIYKLFIVFVWSQFDGGKIDKEQ